MDLFNVMAASCNLDIDLIVPNVIAFVITMIKIIVPIVLIIFGMLDLFKAVIANDDKEMKEAQKKLIHRIIYAVIVFFVIALVQFVFASLAKQDTENGNVDGDRIYGCIDCFINGNDDSCK